MQNADAREKFLNVAKKYGFAWQGTPKTGQTTSYTPYDDGYYQFGKPVITTRFTDLGDGTILDNITRLIWLKEPKAWDDFSADGTTMKTMNWATALTTCKNFTAQGKSDWRLPNIYEFYSLVNRGNANPAIGEVTRGNGGSQLPFVGMSNASFWTSTTYMLDPSLGLRIILSTSAMNTYSKTNPLSVIPVRGGEV